MTEAPAAILVNATSTRVLQSTLVSCTQNVSLTAV